jgi:hypothetical protein
MDAALFLQRNRHRRRRQDFMNSSVERRSKANSARSGRLAGQPMIFNIMDLTPEVNALVFGWLDDSYEFDSLTFTPAAAFKMASRKSCWATPGQESAQEGRRHDRDSRLNVYGCRDLSRRHGARSRCRHHAARSDAAALQPARQGLRLSCAAAPCATRRTGGTYLKRAQGD